MSIDDHIHQCINQHLYNSKCYKWVAREVAYGHIDNSMEKFLNFVKEPGDIIKCED